MDKPDLSKNAVLWWGLRQTESLRESVRDGLRDNAMGNVREWFKKQGTPDYSDVPSALLVSHALTDGFEEGVGIHPELLVRGSNAPAQELVNAGGERSGAGWKNYPNFILTSALVRLLGAWEQFERDVLKALFYHRPSGLLGPASEQLLEEVNVDVICEKGSKKSKDSDTLHYKMPVVWTWLSKPAESRIEREKIFKNVFDIQTIETKEQRKHRDGLYEMRNTIAHGRDGVSMTLQNYIDADVLVAKSMMNISDQCKDKLKLIV